MKLAKIAKQVAYKASGYRCRWIRLAGPLKDVSHLRHQAVFFMGPAGSGKSFVAEGKYLKHMPGGDPEGFKKVDERNEAFKRELDEAQRSLSNVKFERAVKNLRNRNFDIELVDPRRAKIPFRLYDYSEDSRGKLIPRKEWETTLNKIDRKLYREVKGLENVIFKAPVHELPSYWRQVNPDVYKEELAGYRAEKPGLVHEMSSKMEKAYFQAALDTGDPVIVDGTGSNLDKMKSRFNDAKKAGYNISLVYVAVPLFISLMRNATRSRKVDPNIVLQQWHEVSSNFMKLRSKADKSAIVVNTSREYDIDTYVGHIDSVNDFMMENTEKNLTLYEFLKQNAPDEAKKMDSLVEDTKLKLIEDERRRRMKDLGLWKEEHERAYQERNK